MEGSMNTSPPAYVRDASIACLVRLIDGAYIVHDRSTGQRTLTSWPRHIVLGSTEHSAEETVVKRLAQEFVPVSTHVLDAIPSGAPQNHPNGVIGRLLAEGWLELKVEIENLGWLVVRPRTTPIESFPQEQACAESSVLSRFLIVHRSGEIWDVDAPHSWCDLSVSSACVMRAFEEIDSSVGDGGDSDNLLKRVLLWSGALVPEGSEDSTLECAQWSPHELWFHSITRRYGRVRNYGGTFWASGRFEPPGFQPKDRTISDVVELEQFDERASRPSFGTLFDVAERRRSIRKQSEREPLTRKQLGDFLYRTMRLRALHVDEGFEYANKPYPSGGSAYEIETYLLVREVRGIRPGLWRYDSQNHRLECVREGLGDQHVIALLRTITKSSVVSTPPQVAIYLAPRFSRIMWKYEQIGYSVMLKNVGVVMAMMSLVATDMGLAYCAIGSGDSEAFYRAASVDPFDCDSVGELILGTRDEADAF